MKNLYKEVFRSSIKIGDTVCIRKDLDSTDSLSQGEVTKILSNDSNGLKVEITTNNDDHNNPVIEIGFVKYIVTSNGAVYGTI